MSERRIHNLMPFERRDRPLFITESDPAYRTDREKKKRNATERIQKPFGFELFEPKTSDPNTIRELRQRLLILAERSDSSTTEMRAFFREALRDQAVKTHPIVQEVTRGYVGGLNAPAQILSSFIEGGIPDDLLIHMLQTHQEHFEHARQKFAGEVPKMKERFRRNLDTLMQDPRHPLERAMLDPTTEERRLDEVAVIVADPLRLLSEKNRDTIGEYDAEENYAAQFFERPSISSGRESYHEYIYRHEMMHVISGRTIHGADFHHRRIGVSEGYSKRWLNEAITETINQDLRLRGRNFQYGSYINERNIYKELLKKIPERLFLWAYFDNAPSDENKHHDRLIEAVFDAYGFNLLDELDLLDKDELKEALYHFDVEGNWRD